MRALPINSDPVFIRPEHYSSFEKFWLHYLRDERDLPFVKLTLTIAAWFIPLSILIYVVDNPWIWWSASLFYLYLNNLVYKGSFGLMLHCTSHRPWFKSEYGFLNKVLPWILGPFFGQTPETYFSHHLGMHHVENNNENDLSTTMHYQRDSFASFMMYFLDFFFLGLIKLVRYFHIRNIQKLRDKVLFGELAFILLCIGLSFISWPATFVVFVLPFIISRFIMMAGNFTQHAFIDPSDPENHYKNSITCINNKYNQKCWNDGYHISHHVRPGLHWTEHPNHLRNNIDVYAANKALVFDQTHFLPIFFYLMTKKYDVLADHLVNLNGNEFASTEEAIALMKERTKRIPLTGKYINKVFVEKEENAVHFA
ncbi:MAG: fatty acid desaturase [Cytophagaceae bacterium]|jgi:fatty acid desaturase|nr:fatty acid desaturase [Cytophagaceae bacterium]